MAERHISLPKPYAGGNISEWLQRFEICCDSNTWTNDIKARKLPTLLEGEALLIWLELSEDEKKDYDVVRSKLVEKMSPEAFVTLDEFHRRKLRPNESVSMFAYELKKLLQQAMPGIETTAREQLILHQFLAGLPIVISQQLRASGETKELDKVVDRARLLMAINDHSQVATITDHCEGDPVMKELKDQVATLTEQVAALTTRKSLRFLPQENYKSETIRCFICNGTGHMKYECPSRRRQNTTDRCFKCGQKGHIRRNCPQNLKDQGNYQGVSARGNSHPRQW